MSMKKSREKGVENDYILPCEGFVRQPVVLKVLGIGRSTLWREIHAGRYPKPVKLSPRTSAWRVGDIRSLIASFDEKQSLEP